MASSGYTAITFIANEQPTTAKWNLIGSNDSSFNLGTGLEDDVIGSRQIQLANNEALNALNASAAEKKLLKLGTDNYLKLSQLPFQSDNSNSTANSTTEDVLIQYGWQQSNGSGTTQMSIAVTFPTAYTSVPIIMMTCNGAKGGSAATSQTDLTAPQSVVITNVQSPSTTGFTGSMSRTTNFGASDYYSFAWVAIGIKA